jgi:hypothetical protein
MTAIKSDNSPAVPKSICSSACTLLMTATITPPPDVTKLKRMDPSARLADYLEALRFYLGTSGEAIKQIVFVENSASDLTALRELAANYPNKRVEFISFYGLDFPANYGRAYGEFRLIDHAFEQADGILAKLPDDERIWKATGRLRLRNIAAMVANAPAKYNLYCDLRNRRGTWMDLRFYSFTPKGYREIFKGIAEKLREDVVNGRAAEMLIYPLIMEHLPAPRIIPRFRTQPVIAGISGYANKDYDRGLDMLKTYTRMALRRLLPNYWF